MKKSATIDALRAASVLYIVGFWHALGYTTVAPGYPNAITHRLTVVVLGLFVFLSGYLLATKDVSSREDVAAFYRRRLLRIWPLYISAMIVFVLLGLIPQNTAILSAFGASMFYGEQPMTLWFIAMLLIFYALAPLLIRISKAPLVFCICSAALFMLAARYAADPRVAIYFPAFALGVFASRHRASVNALPRTFLILAGLVSILVSALSSGNPEHKLASASMAAVVPLLVLLLVEKVEFRPTLIRWASVLSYSGFAMYLFHRPIYMAYAAFLPASPFGQLLIIWGLALPTIIAISYGIQAAYDRLTEPRSLAIRNSIPQ